MVLEGLQLSSHDLHKVKLKAFKTQLSICLGRIGQMVKNIEEERVNLTLFDISCIFPDN